jgi:O-antigen ligase
MTRAISLALLLIVFLVVQGFVRSQKDLHRFWRAFLLYGVVNAGVTIWQVFTGKTTYVDNIAVRAGGLGVNPSEGAYYTGIALMVAVVYFRETRFAPAWIRSPVTLLLVFGVLSAGLMATASRGGVACVLVGLGGIIFWSGREGRRMRALVQYGIAGLVIGITLMNLPQLTDLFASRVEATGADQLGNRLFIWAQTFQLVASSPVIGTGLDASSIVSSLTRVATTYSTHNTPLAVLLGGGAIGLLLFMWVALRATGILQRLRQDIDVGLHVLGVTASVALLSSAVFMLSYDILFNKLFWAMLALVEATRVVSTAASPAPVAVREPEPAMLNTTT